MLLYLSAPYSQAVDKQALIDELYGFALDAMKNDPQLDIISPLFLHPGLHLRPDMGTDYTFWKSHCESLLSRCDGIIVLEPSGTNVSKSVGVQAEISLAREMKLAYYKGLPGGHIRFYSWWDV